MSGYSLLLLILIASAVGIYLLVFLVCWLKLKLHKKHQWINDGVVPSKDNNCYLIHQRCVICRLCRYVKEKE